MMERKTYTITRDGEQALDISISIEGTLDEGERSNLVLRTYLEARFREKTGIVYDRRRDYARAMIGDTIFICKEAA